MLRQCCHLFADELKLPFRRVRRVVRELFVHVLTQPEHYRKPRGQEPHQCRSDSEQLLFVDDYPKDLKLQCSVCGVSKKHHRGLNGPIVSQRCSQSCSKNRLTPRPCPWLSVSRVSISGMTIVWLAKSSTHFAFSPSTRSSHNHGGHPGEVARDHQGGECEPAKQRWCTANASVLRAERRGSRLQIGIVTHITRKTQINTVQKPPGKPSAASNPGQNLGSSNKQSTAVANSQLTSVK